MNGWLFLHRQILDSRVFNDPDPFLVKLFLWCLCRANWEHGVWKHGCELKPGQFVCGRQRASEWLSVSESKFRRGMEKLKEFGCLTTEATNRFTVVTVVKWAEYQHFGSILNGSRPATDQPPTSYRPATDQLPTTDEEEKKEEEGKKKDTHTPFGVSSFFDRWNSTRKPKRFETDRLREAIELWDGTRRYEGRLIPFQPAEIRAVLESIARSGVSEEEMFDCLAVCAERGWKNFNIDLYRKGKAGDGKLKTFRAQADQRIANEGDGFLKEFGNDS